MQLQLRIRFVLNYVMTYIIVAISFIIHSIIIGCITLIAFCYYWIKFNLILGIKNGKILFDTYDNKMNSMTEFIDNPLYIKDEIK